MLCKDGGLNEKFCNFLGCHCVKTHCSHYRKHHQNKWASWNRQKYVTRRILSLCLVPLQISPHDFAVTALEKWDLRVSFIHYLRSCTTIEQLWAIHVSVIRSPSYNPSAAISLPISTSNKKSLCSLIHAQHDVRFFRNNVFFSEINSYRN